MYSYAWFDEVLGLGLGPALESLGVNHHGQLSILHAWLVCFLLIGGALVARKGLDAARAKSGVDAYVPDSKLTVRNFYELVVDALQGLGHSVLGRKDTKVYFWMIGGLFFYILAGNLMGLVPGFHSPTGDLNTNYAMALVVLVVFNVSGLMRNGFGYIKHMMGPVWWLMPLIFTIELLSYLVVRPFSLTIRLGGNMFGDHMVFGIMSDLIPFVYPSIFLGLGAFVSVIQALVFTLLSAVYVSLAVAHDEDHH